MSLDKIRLPSTGMGPALKLSSSEQRSDNPENSLEKFDVSLCPKPSADKRVYMFVDVQADISQNAGVGREKMAFLSRNAHQRSKLASVKRLKSFPSSSTHASPHNKQDHEAGDTEQMRWNMSPFILYMRQGYVDPFNTSAVPMSYFMNMYFYHCTLATHR